MSIFTAFLITQEDTAKEKIDFKNDISEII